MTDDERSRTERRTAQTAARNETTAKESTARAGAVESADSPARNEHDDSGNGLDVTYVGADLSLRMWLLIFGIVFLTMLVAAFASRSGASSLV